MGVDLPYVNAAPQTGDYHRGLACLLRAGMKTKGWLGDRERSRIVLERGKDGITRWESRNDAVREVGRIYIDGVFQR